VLPDSLQLGGSFPPGGDVGFEVGGHITFHAVALQAYEPIVA
jgi:hypothetical protein